MSLPFMEFESSVLRTPPKDEGSKYSTHYDHSTNWRDSETPTRKRLSS